MDKVNGRVEDSERGEKDDRLKRKREHIRGYRSKTRERSEEDAYVNESPRNPQEEHSHAVDREHAQYAQLEEKRQKRLARRRQLRVQQELQESPQAREERQRTHLARTVNARASHDEEQKEERLRLERERSSWTRAARQKEGPEETAARLAEAREHFANARQNEGPEETVVRLARRRQLRVQQELQESPHAREERQRTHLARTVNARASHDEEQKEERLRLDRERSSRTRDARQKEDPEETVARLAEARERFANARQNEGPEETVLRLATRRQLRVQQELQESPHAREERQRSHLERTVNARAGHDEEQKEERLRRERERSSQTRAARQNEGPEETAARLAEARERFANARQNEGPEETVVRLARRRHLRVQQELQESPHTREERQRTHLERTVNAREGHDEEQTEQRLRRDRERSNQTRNAQRAQIVAPTFDTPREILEDPSNLNFQDFEQNYETAVILWYLNRGLLQYNLQNLEMPEARQQLLKQINNEVLSDEELSNMVYEFQKRNDPLQPLVTCASCGIRKCGKIMTGRLPTDPSKTDLSGYRKIPLDEMDCLRYTSDELDGLELAKSIPALSIPVSETENGTIDVWRLMSLFEVDPLTVYHLHPEFVEEVERGGAKKFEAFVCGRCERSILKQEPPPLSISAGYDFGDAARVGLTPLSQMERIIIAKIRHYNRIVKVKSSCANVPIETQKICGHSIMFDHDSSVVATGLLANPDMHFLDVSKHVKIHFIGKTKEEVDRLMKQMFGTSSLCGRTYVIYQWLQVLHTANALYETDVEHLPTMHELELKLLKLRTKLQQTAVETIDSSIVTLENAIGDDTTKSYDERNSATNPSDFPATYLDTRRPTTSTPAVLKAIAEAGCIDVSQAEGEYRDRCLSQRSENPINDYQYGEKLLCGAFPDVFLFGEGYGNRASLNAMERNHLLFQYTGHAATCHELIFYLFNQYTRHSNALGFAAKIKGNRDAFAKFSSLVGSKEFHEKLKKAVRAPNGKDAKEVAAKIRPVLQMGERRTAEGSSLEIANMTSHIYALSRHYGPGSLFFTIAFDDINNPISFRLCRRSLNNETFPATASELDLNAMVANSTIITENSVTIPADYKERIRLARGNPVMTSYLYGKVLNDVLTILIGVEPARQQAGGARKVRSKYYLQTQRGCRTGGGKGVFGNMVSFIGVTESQHRGSLHFHGIFFGGLRPELLEAVSHDLEMAGAVATVLDSMYRAEIPREMHILNSLSARFPRHRKYTPPVMHARKTTPENIYQQSRDMAHVTNYHKHTFTCHKPPSGHKGCRLCFGRGNVESTCVVQLDPASVEDEVPVVMERVSPPEDRMFGPVMGMDPRILAWEIQRRVVPTLDDIPVDLPPHDQDRKNWIIATLQAAMLLIPNRDEVRRVIGCLKCLTLDGLEIIYSELRDDLPSCNRFVVEHNPTITSLVGCNTDAMLLGNMEQSKGTLFYLAPYLQKDKFEALQMLTIVLEAHRYMEDIPIETPSVAGEAESIERFVQKWFARAINSLDVAKEITLNQATATLLGQDMEMNGDSFSMVGIREAENWRAYRAYREGTYDGMDDVDSEDKYDSDDSFLASESESQAADDFETDDEQETHQNDNSRCVDLSAASSDDLLESDITGQFEEDANRARTPPDPVEVSNMEGLHEEWSEVMTHCNSSQFEDYGPATIYKVTENGTTIPIPVFFPNHYDCRGDKLRDMNRAEYYSLIQVKRKPQRNSEQKENSGNIQPGRKNSKIYDFGSGHPLQATHTQVLRSIQTVPIYTKRQPKPPQLDAEGIPENLAIADSFASYYLTAFRPEIDDFDDNHRNKRLGFKWKDFCDFVVCMELKAESGSFIAEARLHSLRSAMNGLATFNIAKKILASHRKRQRDLWSSAEQQQANQRLTLEKNAVHMETDEDCTENFTWMRSEQGLAQALNEIRLNDAIQQTFAKLTDTHEVDLAPAVTSGLMTDMAVLEKCQLISDAITSYARYGECDLDLPSLHDGGFGVPPGSMTSFDERLEDARSSLREQGCTESQENVASKVINEVERQYVHGYALGNDGKAFLITGQPGTGKSFLIKTLADLIHIIDEYKMTKTSYMGGAAIGIDGETCCSSFQINSRRPETKGIHNKVEQLTSEKVFQFQKTLGLDRKDDRFGIIVIDEISMITPQFFEHINSRLKQATGMNSDFGGLLVLLFGDFDQLPPVGSTNRSLVQVAQRLSQAKVTRQRWKHAEDTGDYHNLRILRQPKEYLKQKKWRQKNKSKTQISADDNTNATKGVELFQKAIWMPLLEQVRSEDPMHTELINKIAGGQRIALSDLRQYKALTKTDMEYEEWSFAPILVSTNRQRLDFAHSQSIRFAKMMNTCVIRWKVPFKNWVGKPKEALWESAKANDPCFWQYFIKGAPAYMTFNRCVKLGIANGTEVTLDSLMLTDEQELFILDQMQNGKPGDVVSLKDPPQCVNVELVNVSTETWKSKFNNRRMSLQSDRVVIPLFKSKGTNLKSYVVRGGSNYLPSKTLAGNLFDYDLGFSMTVHKAQGRTLKRVILCFDQSPCPFNRLTIQHVYVCLSRVRRCDHIRFILKDPNDLSPLWYITRLDPDETTKAYFEGFNGPGSVYCAEKAYEYLRQKGRRP